MNGDIMNKNTQSILIKGKLNGKQRNRVKSLLDMMYTPRELSEEIGVNKNQIYRVYIPLGCPHERDEKDHILINGEVFKAWVIDLYKKKHLKGNQAYCVSCKQIVEIIAPETASKNGVVYKLSTCPNCGNHVTRIVSSKKKKE